jgi:hypothetical protein
MARRPTLEIDGVKYKNVYEVSYEIYTAKDETGRPSDRAHAGTIKILRESDENDAITSWAMDSAQPNWKAGSVTIRKPDDSEMKVLAWEDGFITRYEERVPHVKNSPDEQVNEYFEISCHKITIGSAMIDNLWEE